MKRSKRMIFRIVLMSLLVFSLSACSDSDVPSINMDVTLSHTVGDDDINFDGVFSATDEEDGDVTASIVIDDDSVDYLTAGTYTITVTAKDAAGNVAESVFDITIKNETVPPVIIGMENVSLKQGEDDYVYSTGVTASDIFDGDITSSIIIDDSEVNYTTIGIYRVYFNVSDSSGNEASESINVSIVSEIIAPTLDGIEDKTIGLDTELPSFLSGVTANDNLDGDITSAIVVTHSTIDTSVLGTYIITYTIKDAALNTTIETVTLNVVDMTPPVIEGTRNLSFKVFTEPNFLWSQITIFDNIDGDLLSEIVFDDSEVDMSVLGAYDLTYSVTDAAGNTTSITVTVNVKDYTKPDFVLNEIIYYLDGDATPNYLDYIQVIDNYDGDISDQVIFDDSSVDLNSSGVYTIIMTVVDTSGNSMSAELELVVPTETSVNNVLDDIAEYTPQTTPIDENLVLPSVGTNGSTIVWNSLNDLHMTDAGKILPPGIGELGEFVTLVATYTFDNYAKTIEYELIVAPKEEATIDSKETYDYIALGEEYVSSDGTLDAYYEPNGNVPYVDISDLLEVSKGAVDFDLLEFSYTAPILTVTYDVEYEDDDGIMQTDTYTAYFDFEENTVTSASSDFFNGYMESTSSSFGDGLTFIGSEGLDPHEIVFDLGYYGFDMVVYDDSGEDKFLIPFNILELLLFGDTYYDVYFNHESFFGTEHWQLSNSSDASSLTARTSTFNSATMPRDLKMAAYNYMAFTMDYYYGIKDFLGIETYYTELEPYINDMIYSNDVDFYRALFEFVYGLDDPHSSHSSTGYYENTSYGYSLSLADLGDRVAGYYQKSWSVQDSYEEKYGTSIPSPYLLPDGKTAIIYISGFAIETPDEFKAALDLLPPEIENVIVDVANNGGGNSGAAWRVFGYMTEETFSIHFQNPLDGSAITYNYESEYDAYDYNWFVLTSPVTFSAANMFANIAQELGIPLIGQNSSGGASSIQLIQPFGGSALIISSNSVISGRTFNEETGEYEYYSLEYGVEVDYEIIDFLNDEDLIAAINDILNIE